MAGILVFFHCESNPGFAAARHEITFFSMAKRLVGRAERIHFAYPSLANGRSSTLPDELTNIIEFDARSRSHQHLSKVEQYVRENDIQLAFGFDQPVQLMSHKYMRRGGVRRIIAYWGAPMSSINHGLKLLFKRIDVALSPSRPDHFIFQSEGMRSTATRGRGIPSNRTSVVHTGIDTGQFCPPGSDNYYAHRLFNIDIDKLIVFFSGHMEERKGVGVIIETALYITHTLGRSNIHFLIVGDKNGQKEKFTPLYEGTLAEPSITFGGYRNDVPELLKSCSIGFIASTGWDSFPMSSIEIAATGLPLVVSDLPGLREAVSRETGFLYPAGDYIKAAECICTLVDDDVLRRRMGNKGRQRAIEDFSVENQISNLESVVREVAGAILPVTDAPPPLNQAAEQRLHH